MTFQPAPAAASDPLSIGLGPFAREIVERGRADLRARHDAGASGREILRAHTLLMDRLITCLFTAASQEYSDSSPRIRHRCAVMAQGGYGRRELSPFSDIDLVFLYPWKATPYVKTVAERILYSLWDTGAVVGHSLRNPHACVRLGERDSTIKTALLDARYICGDVPVFEEFKAARQAELLGKRGRHFFEEKLAERAERHRRHGDSVYLLEPNIQEGEGGLRDSHTALWMAKVRFKIRSLRDLVALCVLTDRELREFEVSQDFLWRVRNALHFRTGTHQDQLTFEHQEQIAANLGYPDTPPERGVDRFMRVYYLHAAAVYRFSEELISRCIEGTRAGAASTHPARTVQPGMVRRGNLLSVTGRKAFWETPANLVRVFEESQRHGVALSPATKRQIRGHLQLLGGRMQCDPGAIRAFLGILRSRSRVYETLHEMHKQGVLISLIPEFSKVLCCVQRDLYHIYTVDEHSLRGVLELERLRAGAYEQDCPLLTQLMREEDNIAILFLAVLFHDIGKGKGHGHSERGAVFAGKIARRFGLNTDDTMQLQFLVRHHLLMANLAQRRDIRDESLVLGFAKQVCDVSTLRRLYLLTFADMKTLRPGLWNNWRDMLLIELYVRALQVLERGGFVEEDRMARVARIKGRLKRALRGTQDEQGLGAFLRTMPANYFLTTPEDSIPEHVRVAGRFRCAAREGGVPVETLLRHFPEWDHSEFTICTADRPGLFSMLAGVLAAGGLNVVNARISTSTEGMALDEFRVSHGERREAVLEETRWRRLRRNLDAVLRGERDVETLVAESQRSTILSRSRKGLGRAATAVVVDNAVSREYTVLDVYTEDRIGLLFSITRCLYRLGLRIHLAKITTSVDQVLDVFYVTDEHGRKIEDAATLESIRRDLTDRLMRNAGAEGGAGA